MQAVYDSESSIIYLNVFMISVYLYNMSINVKYKVT